MAKTSGKSKTRVSGADRAKRATKGSKASVSAQSSYEHEDHIDGCDLEFHDSDATLDAELPAATGGVEIAKGKGRPRPQQRG
jgi:hypothetical protein